MAEQDTITGIPDRDPVPGVRRGPGARRAVLYAATLLFLAAMLGLNTPKGLFEETLYDLRHVFAFGFGSLIVLELTALVGRRWIRKRSLYYAIALVFTGIVAVLVRVFGEAGMDMAAGDLVGITGFLLVSGSLDQPLRREHYWLRGWPRRIIQITGLLLVVAALYPLIVVGTYYAGRAGAFPVVVDLEADWQQPFISVADAELFSGKGPEEWPRRAGREVAVIFFDGVPGGGVSVAEPYQDWRGFDVLSMHIYSRASEPVEMTLRLSDRTPEQAPEERSDWPLLVMPGENDYYLDIEALRETPSGRKLKLSTIRKFGLYLAEPTEPFRIYIHHVRISEQ